MEAPLREVFGEIALLLLICALVLAESRSDVLVVVDKHAQNNAGVSA